MPGINTAMGCVALNAEQWLFCILVGATSLPVNLLVCMIRPEWLPTWTVSWQVCIFRLRARARSYFSTFARAFLCFVCVCMCERRSTLTNRWYFPPFPPLLMIMTIIRAKHHGSGHRQTHQLHCTHVPGTSIYHLCHATTPPPAACCVMSTHRVKARL